MFIIGLIYQVKVLHHLIWSSLQQSWRRVNHCEVKVQANDFPQFQGDGKDLDFGTLIVSWPAFTVYYFCQREGHVNVNARKLAHHDTEWSEQVHQCSWNFIILCRINFCTLRGKNALLSRRMLKPWRKVFVVFIILFILFNNLVVLINALQIHWRQKFITKPPDIPVDILNPPGFSRRNQTTRHNLVCILTTEWCKYLEK